MAVGDVPRPGRTGGLRSNRRSVDGGLRAGANEHVVAVISGANMGLDHLDRRVSPGPAP